MKRLLIAGCLLLPVCVGCSVGSRAIRSSYASYNETIAFNQDQQMLLNLVRLKYRETPLFLKVGALSASYDFSIDAGVRTGRVGGGSFYDVAAGPRYSTRPTITYTPIEGNTFVKQVLAEVDPDTMILLFRSGWSILPLCHVLVERIGPYINNEEEPSYEKFVAFVDALRAAQKRDQLEFVTIDGDVFLDIPDDEEYRIPGIGDDRDGGAIPIEALQLRSFLDIMFFLGKNTRVPRAHADYVKHSEPNGWIDIRTSQDKPDDAMVWVGHRGHHFSIANTDIQSKDTFALLKLLFQIQAGDIKTVQPILTLPVATP